jgi:hypothetical protein
MVRYRCIIAVLANLKECVRIVLAAGRAQLAESIWPVLVIFERQDKANALTRTERKHVLLDRYSRSHTVGKCKESAVRVWMIPVCKQAPTVATLVSTRNSDADLLAPTVGNAFAPSPAAAASPVPVNPTMFLVNKL